MDQRLRPRRWPRSRRRATHGLAEVLEVAALVAAAHDRDDAAVETLDARAAPTTTLVAFESLTNRTPSISATRSSACSRPAKPFDRALHRRRRHAGHAAHGRGRQHVGEQMPARAAAPTRPATAASRRPRSRRTISPPSTVTPSSSGASSAKSKRRARRAARQRQRGGIVGVDDGPVVGVWFAKMRALACRVLVERRVPIEVVGDRFSSTAIHGWNVSVVSSWKLLTSTTWSDVGRDSATCALRAVPRLPPAVDVEAGFLQHPRRQRRRRRLAFRAGDRDRRGPRASATPARFRR